MEQRPNRGIGKSQVTRVVVPEAGRQNEMKEIRATGDLAFWPLLLGLVTPFGPLAASKAILNWSQIFSQGKPNPPGIA